MNKPIDNIIQTFPSYIQRAHVSTKLFDVAHDANGGFNERMLKEIAKCDVMCKPCHIEHHLTLKGN